MTDSAPPPGGPLPPEFRDTISALAKQAREEDRRGEQEARKRQARRPISPIIKIGVALVALELASLAILSSQKNQRAILKSPPPDRIHSRNDCPSAVNRTYWKIVTYIRDEDHPPATLDDLIPKYLDKLPFDPATGKPLEYSSDGKHFDLHCPGQAARK